MTELFEKSIRVLELPQLLERLSQKAVSEAAKERALRLTPSTDADDVRRLQDETDAARALIGLRGSPSFSGVKDVREALARAERGGMLNPRELLTIAGLLTNSRRVREYYEADQGEGTVLDRMFDSLHANRFLEDKITTSILSEDEIADAASPELADIRRHKRAASAKGRQILQKIISSPSYKSTLQEALITQRDGRFVVPVKAEHRGDLPGLVHEFPPPARRSLLSRWASCRRTTSSRSWRPRKKRRSSASSSPSPPRRQASPRRFSGITIFSSTSTSSLPAAS